jgi:hypothetical protein
MNPVNQQSSKISDGLQKKGWTRWGRQFRRSRRSECCRGAGQHQSESIARFEAAVRLRPDLADAQYNLGVALSGIPGRLPEAVHRLEEADHPRPDPAIGASNCTAAWQSDSKLRLVDECRFGTCQCEMLGFSEKPAQMSQETHIFT